MSEQLNWWRGGVIYQIYPRSYADANGDGIGDLPGIIGKLDYIASLNVDAIWLSPFFTSPMKDFGYDVADYCDVDPLFGNLADFKTLVDKAHRLGLKVIIDQVYSHCSDQHAWFVESRQDKTNPKADWYVWADAKPDGTPPNNWLSLFGGPAWRWDSKRSQYFMHNFLDSQPDLNFHNPQVQDAVLDTARFWLELGVDGFRLDVVNMFFHDLALKDNPIVSKPEELFVGIDPSFPFCRQYHINQMCRDDNLAFLQRFRSVLDGYPGTTSIGEIGAPDGMTYMAQYTSDGDKLHMAYTFELLSAQHDVGYIRNTISRVEDKLTDGWPCFSLSNHDVVRSATRWASEEEDPQSYIKAALALLLTLRGSPCLYQGEELGLPDGEVGFEDLQDPFGIEFWPEYKGRDGCRTPMPWDTSKNAGFSTAEKTWLPVDAKHQSMAVAVQEQDTQSTLHFTRALLAWRQAQPALQGGDFEWIDSHPDVLVFARTVSKQRLVIAINLTAQVHPLNLSGKPVLVAGFAPHENGVIGPYQVVSWEQP